LEKPTPVPFEQNFENTFPVDRNKIDKSFTDEITFEFTGNGYLLYGNMVKRAKIDADYIDRIAKRTYGSEPLGLAELNDPYVAVMTVHNRRSIDRHTSLAHDEQCAQTLNPPGVIRCRKANIR
jgi:hypothetical protein